MKVSEFNFWIDKTLKLLEEIRKEEEKQWKL